MEQTPTSSGRSPELPSVLPPSPEKIEGTFSSHEMKVGGLAERQERRSGNTPRAEQAAPPIIALPTPASPVVSDDTTATAQAVSVLPTVAGDDDLIEKEWVDKAKKVLAETKDDPYRREQEVGRLQADYLAKRYGRELGSVQ